MKFEDIYSEYYPRVFRICMSYANDEERAKDLVQETFINVWKYLPGFRNESSIHTWLYRIATNVCLRNTAQEKKYFHAPVPEQLPDAGQPDTEEKMRILYICISSLPESERILISLMLEGLPGADIASITGLSEGNVRVKIHRLKDKLFTLYKAYEQL